MRAPPAARLAVALAILAASPAAAEIYELFPTNTRSPDGTYRGVLEVWIGRGPVEAFRVDRGEIGPQTVLDPNRAIAFVIARYGLSAARDVVYYCPLGTVRVACFFPFDRDDPFDFINRVVRWP
jgi:hypothetical protein